MPDLALQPAPVPGAAASATPRTAAVGHVGVALPETRVSSATIGARLGVDERWIVERTGVRERRVAAPSERLTDLAALAGERALARAGLPGAGVDLVLLAPTTPDEILPPAAPQVAAALGAHGAAAIDIGFACAGFVPALGLACGQIESGRARTALVIGADRLTRHLDPDDRGTAPLFGDGAGAVVVRAAGGGGVGPLVIRADGGQPDLVRIGHGEPMAMRGHETYVHAVRRLAELTRELLALGGIGAQDVDLFVYHQANSRILRALGERLDLPADRVVDVVGRHGNTSAASSASGIDAAEHDGRLRDGARVLIGAFGAGFVWGGALLTWGAGP